MSWWRYGSGAAAYLPLTAVAWSTAVLTAELHCAVCTSQTGPVTSFIIHHVSLNIQSGRRYTMQYDMIQVSILFKRIKKYYSKNSQHVIASQPHFIAFTTSHTWENTNVKRLVVNWADPEQVGENHRRRLWLKEVGAALEYFQRKEITRRTFFRKQAWMRYVLEMT